MSSTTEQLDTSVLELKKYHDVFLGNLVLLLELINTQTSTTHFEKFCDTTDETELLEILGGNFDVSRVDKDRKQIKLIFTDKINEYLTKTKTTSQNFLKAILGGGLNMDGVSNIIKKIFNVINNHLELFRKDSYKIFQTKTKNQQDKLVTVTLIPGIDLMFVWLSIDKENKKKLWKFLKNMYIGGTKMIQVVNGTINNDFVQEINYLDLKKDYLERFPDSTILNPNNLEFDPWLGVGVNGGDFGVDSLIETSKLSVEKQQSQQGISSMVKMLGVDKLLNMEELSKNLKNIDTEQIKDATENIKKMLGNNVDEGTSEIIGDMITNITSELKSDALGEGDPLQNIVKIAESVAKKMIPKINDSKIDMGKILESTQNITSNIKDAEGNNIFNGQNNPLSILSNLMKKQLNTMTPEEQQAELDNSLQQSQQMMQQMGLPNINPEDIFKMMTKK